MALESFKDVNVEKRKITLTHNDDDYILVQSDTEYTLNIGLKRIYHSRTLKAHCPMFQKGKDESWFLILGDVHNKELLALKRVSGVNSQHRYHQLQFTTPRHLGKFIHVICVSLVVLKLKINFRTDKANVLLDFRLLYRIGSTIQYLFGCSKRLIYI